MVNSKITSKHRVINDVFKKTYEAEFHSLLVKLKGIATAKGSYTIGKLTVLPTGTNFVLGGGFLATFNTKYSAYTKRIKVELLPEVQPLYESLMILVEEWNAIANYLIKYFNICRNMADCVAIFEGYGIYDGLSNRLPDKSKKRTLPDALINANKSIKILEQIDFRHTLMELV